jgi:hypothetical protein
VDEPYWFRRVVTYCVWYQERGRTLEETVAASLKRAPAFDPDWVRKAWPIAEQSLQNRRRIFEADPKARICDIAGCEFPEGATDGAQKAD